MVRFGGKHSLPIVNWYNLQYRALQSPHWHRRARFFLNKGFYVVFLYGKLYGFSCRRNLFGLYFFVFVLSFPQRQYTFLKLRAQQQYRFAYKYKRLYLVYSITVFFQLAVINAAILKKRILNLCLNRQHQI